MTMKKHNSPKPSPTAADLTPEEGRSIAAWLAFDAAGADDNETSIAQLLLLCRALVYSKDNVTILSECEKEIMPMPKSFDGLANTVAAGEIVRMREAMKRGRP